MLAEIFAFWLGTQAFAPEPALFRPLQREVSNWRGEAALALDFTPLEAGGVWLRHDPKGLSRCVRLNNYWCIKRAGWAGEIAADTEGHVAFSSAGEGALVAAVLLKRYYVDFKRHTAMEIISRWAPAQCGGGGPVASGRGKVGPRLAPRGLGNTLRARFLAHRRGGAPLRRSVIADRPVPALRAPSIAVGFGERDTVLPVLNFGNLPNIAAGIGAGGGGGSCGGDGARIANYASRASEGIAAPNADLKLFDAAGLPTPALPRMMSNMASVEIGPLRVRQNLVYAAVTALMARLMAAQEPHF